MDPTSNDSVREIENEKTLRHKGERPCEDGHRDWGNASASQEQKGFSADTKKWKTQGKMVS